MAFVLAVPLPFWPKGWVALAERSLQRTWTAFRSLCKSPSPFLAVHAGCEHNEHEVKEQEVRGRAD